jgi:hypothetical protein
VRSRWEGLDWFGPQPPPPLGEQQSTIPPLSDHHYTTTRARLDHRITTTREEPLCPLSPPQPPPPLKHYYWVAPNNTTTTNTNTITFNIVDFFLTKSIVQYNKIKPRRFRGWLPPSSGDKPTLLGPLEGGNLIPIYYPIL